MGNINYKSSVAQSNSVNGVYRKKRGSAEQIQIDASQRSHTSAISNQSGFSFCRSNSRLSRRSNSGKETWPVSQLESSFLPLFPVHFESLNSQFFIIEEIAKGAFGRVFKVKETATENLYALKVLSKSKILTENAIQQVKEEVQIQRACGHHNYIVNCPYHWQSKKNLYIVTDYIEGGELSALIKRYRQLPLNLIKIYVAQIALVLDFLQNAGIIYRDLKPENILLDKFGNVQLTDFGLSKWLPYGKKTKTICGTLKYIAPEVLSKQPYGHAADWWSLGVIACIMFTSQFPSTEGINEEDESTSRKVNLPIGTVLDVPSKDLLLRLLEVDPSKRLRSLRTLLTIGFYKDFKMKSIENKTIIPNEILQHFFPDGPKEEEPKNLQELDISARSTHVENFDEVIE